MINAIYEALHPVMKAGLSFKYNHPKEGYETDNDNIVLCVAMPENSANKTVELIVELTSESDIFQVFARWETDYLSNGKATFFEVEGFFSGCSVGDDIRDDGSVLYVHGKDLSKALEFAVKPAVYSYTEAQFGMLDKLEVCFRR